MQLIDKANVLSDFFAMRNDEAWLDFFDEHYYGVLMGHLLATGNVLELTQDGETMLNDAYAALLDEWGVEDAEYASLNDLIIGKTNEENE